VQSIRDKILFLLVTYIALIPAFTDAGASDDISPVGPSLQPQALSQVGIYQLRQLEPDLTGSAVKFAVICRSFTYIAGEPQNDYRPSIGHNCFDADRFVFYDQDKKSTGFSSHSTAICSILFGEDTDAFNPYLGQFYYQGVAPQAKADIYEFWYFLINNVFPNSPPDVDIIAAGFGSQFEDWWTRGVESLVEHCGLIVVAGIGNGSNANDPLLYPGAGANVIGVGVVNSVNTEDTATNLSHFSLAYPENSSFGPTADGRCKPDIVAPGNCLVASTSDSAEYEMTGSWSSFSTPVVAGVVGLLIQKAKEEPNLNLALSKEGGDCVIKAILMNSANKLPYWHKGRMKSDDDNFVPLDYIQGAGMLNAIGAYKHLVAGRNEPGIIPLTGWDNNFLNKNQSTGNIYKITVEEPAGKLIAATVVWNRHYSRVYPFESLPAKDRNLRLELWAIDPSDSSRDCLLDYSDSEIDNVEHIYCKLVPDYTNYEIVVSYSEAGEQVISNQQQRYGVAWDVCQVEEDDSIFWHDLNADGIVNELDYAVFLDNWIAGIRTAESYLIGDVNTDGTIDVNDLKILLDHNDHQADWYTK
jgi:hypothetical protein